jgi:hypothetical protein
MKRCQSPMPMVGIQINGKDGDGAVFSEFTNRAIFCKHLKALEFHSFKG